MRYRARTSTTAPRLNQERDYGDELIPAQGLATGHAYRSASSDGLASTEPIYNDIEKTSDNCTKEEDENTDKHIHRDIIPLCDKN